MSKFAATHFDEEFASVHVVSKIIEKCKLCFVIGSLSGKRYLFSFYQSGSMLIPFLPLLSIVLNLFYIHLLFEIQKRSVKTRLLSKISKKAHCKTLVDNLDSVDWDFQISVPSCFLPQKMGFVEFLRSTPIQSDVIRQHHRICSGKSESQDAPRCEIFRLHVELLCVNKDFRYHSLMGSEKRNYSKFLEPFLAKHVF